MSAPAPHTACEPPLRLAGGLWHAAACLTAFVILYRPMASGLVDTLPSTAIFGLLLLTCVLLWLGSELLRGEVRVRLGLPAAAFGAFVAASLASSLIAENWFAGLRWWLLIGTYGLTGFLVMQMARREPERRFFHSCLLASAVALAAFGLWHYVLYMPALRGWLAREPDFFRGAVGAAGPMARDLEARVAADRAYGSFITANQLADFLVVTIFALGGCALWLWRARREARQHAGAVLGAKRPSWWITCTLAAMLSLLYLTRSKGGWAAFLFGLAVVGLTAGRRLVRRHRWAAPAGVAAAIVLLLIAYEAGALPRPRQFADSLGVRLGYWQTSIRIGRERPLLGVGPGSWADWYAMLKEPEFEETRSPHSLYFQLWAETGAAGLLLWAAFWAVLFVQALRPAAAPGEDAAEAGGPPDDGRTRAAERPRWLTVAGPAMAAAALLFDYGLMGTFSPPRYVPDWLQAMPWLPYVGIWAVWAATFLSLYGPGLRGIASSPWPLTAGLAAFLLHSAAEFTLQVPAIGGTVAVLCGLLLSGSGAPAERRVRLGPAGQAAVLAVVGACIVLYSAVAVRRVVTAGSSTEAADSIRMGLASPQGAPDARSRIEEATAEARRACAALPWDDAAWRELAVWLLSAGDPSMLAEAVRVAERAAELNPLHSANWSLLGTARAWAGDAVGAAQAYERAARLHPSLPESWYRYGRALERAGRRDAAAEAFGRALELMPRQYHPRNLVLGGPSELMQLWREGAGAAPGASLLSTAADLASRVEGAHIPAGAPERDLVSRLTKGLPGAPELAHRWDSYDEPTRERELWNVLGGRLWGWALRAKLQALEEGQRNAQENGAGGGT